MIDRTALVIAVFVGCGLLFFLLERLVPLRAPKRALFGRLVVNLAFSALALGVATLLVQPAVAASCPRR